MAVRKALVSRSRQMRDLIESLLDLALSESGESRLNLATVDWTSTMTRWVADFEDRLGRRLRLELPDASCASEADAAKMERVLFNLVSNAAKFSVDDHVADHRSGWRRRRARSSSPSSTRAWASCPATSSSIFEPFLQLDGGSTREQGGLGIGLTLVRHFVRLHGGRVEVDVRRRRGLDVPHRDPAQGRLTGFVIR